MFTGLQYTRTHYNIVVACDMPFLNEMFLRCMVEVAPGYDAVVPVVHGMIEPLHTVYSKACMGPIEQLISRGELGLSKVFDLVRTRYMQENEIDRFDPERLSYFNINTDSDLQNALGIINKRK